MYHTSRWSIRTTGLLLLTLAAPLNAQVQGDSILPGDARLHPEQIQEHTATHRFVQYGADGPVEVGRLSRSVERVHHTADEPSILVSMQFRNPTRSGLDIVYLDARTLSSSVRYLTAPTGMTTMYQLDGGLHVTYSGRNGQRMTADTVLSYPRFGGSSDLVLASLDIPQGATVLIPEISGSASTLESSLIMNAVTYQGTERIDIPGVWGGTVSVFRQVRNNGSSVTYFIAQDGPHLIRQDFFTAEGERFLSWELAEYSNQRIRYGS